MNYRLIVLLCLFGLIAAQLLWQLGLGSTAGIALAIWLSIGLTPALLCLLSVALRRPTGLFWSGVIALMYFCHGVTEAWVGTDAVRWVATFEAVAAFVLVSAVGADGFTRRRQQRG